MRGQHGKRVDNPFPSCFQASDPGHGLPTLFPHFPRDTLAAIRHSVCGGLLSGGLAEFGHLRDLAGRQLEILVDQVLDRVGRSALQAGLVLQLHAFAHLDELLASGRRRCFPVPNGLRPCSASEAGGRRSSNGWP